MAPTAALSLLTLLALQAAAQDVTYFEIGGNLDLNPAFSGEITSFTISNMSQSDGGLFTVEINNKVLPVSYNAVGVRKLDDHPVEVIMRPLTCLRSSTECTLTCWVDLNDAEPVQYFWKRGEVVKCCLWSPHINNP